MGLREVVVTDTGGIGRRLVSGEMGQQAAISQRGRVTIHDEEAPAGSSLCDDFARSSVRVGIAGKRAVRSS
jgi:hypothetical protein